MCLSRETENPSMTCLLSSFAGFHWKGKIPMGFARLHPPGATGAASGEELRGSAKGAAASAVHQGPPCHRGCVSIGTGQAAELRRACSTGDKALRFYLEASFEFFSFCPILLWKMRLGRAGFLVFPACAGAHACALFLSSKPQWLWPLPLVLLYWSQIEEGWLT